MKIPNCEKAVVEIAKIRDYCLNSNHKVGKHKAHVFKSVLGLTMKDAEMLQTVLLQTVTTTEGVIGEKDDYGQRYTLDFEMSVGDKQATIRSAWIIRTDEDFPRLTSCYVL